MPYQYYSIHGIGLGTRLAPMVEVTRGGHQRPMSYVFICPSCGEDWARISCDADGTYAPWSPISASCNRCGNGTLDFRWLPITGPDVPIRVLQHEFLCALAQFERSIQQQKEEV